MIVSTFTVNTLSVRRTCPKEMFGAKTNVTFPFYLFLSLYYSPVLVTLVTPVVSLAIHTFSYYFVGFVGNLGSKLHQQLTLQLMTLQVMLQI